MSSETLGEIFALLAALTWAFSLVLFRYSGEHVVPLALNLFKCAVGIVLLAATLLLAPLLPGLLGDQSVATFRAVPVRSLWLLVLSGVIGIALADTLFFICLNRIGVGLISIVDCLYTPFVILFSWMLLPHEVLTVWHLVGAGLILGGVLVSSGHAPPPNTTRGQVVAGVCAGASAMAAMALSIVIAKPALEATPVIWASAVRMVAGTVALAVVVMLLPARKALWLVFRPSVAWKTSIPAAFLGTYLAYIFWIAGFKNAGAAVNAILNQTSIIFAIILATVVVKEPLTKRKLVSVGLAIVGVVFVLHDKLAAML